nr:putative ribonuclease h protein [Quercus suber]
MQTREFLYCVADLRKGKTKTSRLVKWLKPLDGWWKLNTDGSFVVSSGLAGGGGIIRDSRGLCIGGFARSCVVTSSLAADLWALREGLLRCIELQEKLWSLSLMLLQQCH